MASQQESIGSTKSKQGDLELVLPGRETPDEQREASPREKVEETGEDTASPGNQGQWQANNVAGSFYRNLGQHTDLGDGIYYTDGHFSCYYGKYKIPKGYDPRRKQPARGRNTIYLHNSLGHNILSFESPTNTSLSVDIETLIEKQEKYSSEGQIESKR